MQHRYVGDIGDYVKYSLLRALSKKRSLGIAWYLRPDEFHNNDGKHVSYLQSPEDWRHLDKTVFDCLYNIVKSNKRHLSSIENAKLFKDAVYANQIIDINNLKWMERIKFRNKWFKHVKETLKDCDIVFLDPDNGLCGNDKFDPTKKECAKRLPLKEALELARDRVVIIYHHNTRRKGGHLEEINYWLKQLGPNVVAIRWRKYSCRAFFIVNADSDLKIEAKEFAKRWGPKAEFIELNSDAYQTKKNICEVCNEREGYDVFASGIAPVSNLLCKECYKNEAEPLDLTYAKIAMNGGPERFPKFKDLSSYYMGIYINKEQIFQLYQNNRKEIEEKISQQFGIKL